MHSINCNTMGLELIHLWQSGTQASLNLIIVLFSLKNVMSYVKQVPDRTYWFFCCLNAAISITYTFLYKLWLYKQIVVAQRYEISLLM